MKRTGPYYFHSILKRVFMCRWYIPRTGMLNPLSDFKSWCDPDGTHYWGFDLSATLRHGRS